MLVGITNTVCHDLTRYQEGPFIDIAIGVLEQSNVHTHRFNALSSMFYKLKSFFKNTLISLEHLKLKKRKITDIILHVGYYEFKKDLDTNDMTVQIHPYSLFEWEGTRGVCVKCIFIICPLPISLEHLKLRKRKITDIWRMMKHIKHEMYPTCPCESQQSVYAVLQSPT